MVTLKTVLRALCSYEKKHVLCEPKSKSSSVFKRIVFEDHKKRVSTSALKGILLNIIPKKLDAPRRGPFALIQITKTRYAARKLALFQIYITIPFYLALGNH